PSGNPRSRGHPRSPIGCCRTLIFGSFGQHVGTFAQGASRDHGPSIGMRTLDGPPSRHGGGRHRGGNSRHETVGNRERGHSLRGARALRLRGHALPVVELGRSGLLLVVPEHREHVQRKLPRPLAGPQPTLQRHVHEPGQGVRLNLSGPPPGELVDLKEKPLPMRLLLLAFVAALGSAHAAVLPDPAGRVVPQARSVAGESAVPQSSSTRWKNASAMSPRSSRSRFLVNTVTSQTGSSMLKPTNQRKRRLYSSCSMSSRSLRTEQRTWRSSARSSFSRATDGRPVFRYNLAIR